MVKQEPESGLYTAELRLTKACNLRCRHCSVSGGERAVNELTSIETKRLIESLSRMGAHYIVLTGGEPLLCRDIVAHVRHARALGLKVLLDTNGTLMTQQLARKLKRAGLGMVQVSIEGSEKTHELIRGEGSFERALTGAENAIQAGMPVGINFTVSRLNRDELKAVAEIARSIGARSLSLERFVAVGRGKGMREKTLGAREFREVLAEFYSLNGIRKICTDPLALLLREGLLSSYDAEELERRICGGCTAGIAAVCISYDGEVYPCPKLEVSCGNVRRQPLERIWMESAVLNEMRRRSVKGRCMSCRLRNLCGGCRAAAYAEKGDYLAEDPACFGRGVRA